MELIKEGVPVIENKTSYESIHHTLLTYQQRLDHEHQERFEQKTETNQLDEQMTEQLNLFAE